MLDQFFVDVDVLIDDEVGDVAAVSVVVVGEGVHGGCAVEEALQCAFGFFAFGGVAFHGVDASETHGFDDGNAEAQVQLHFYGVAIDDIDNFSGITVTFTGLNIDGGVAGAVLPSDKGACACIDTGQICGELDIESEVDDELAMLLAGRRNDFIVAGRCNSGGKGK